MQRKLKEYLSQCSLSMPQLIWEDNCFCLVRELVKLNVRWF
jgi:hypothetical protein